MHKQILLWLMFTAMAVPAHAQESGLQADFRGEGERLKKSCLSFDFKSLGSCAQVLFTDHPLHIAAGASLPKTVSAPEPPSLRTGLPTKPGASTGTPTPSPRRTVRGAPAFT